MSWHNVLLTDSGLYDPFDLNRPLRPIVDRFAAMLGKPFSDARVLFIPAAVCDDEGWAMARILRRELLWLGCVSQNITDYMLDGSKSEDEVMTYDVMFFTGGWDTHLLKCINRIGFDRIVRKFVAANKVYIGVSAGSIVATPGIRGCFGAPEDPESKSMGLIHAYVDVHCNLKPKMEPKILPLPYIALQTHQALAVSADGYELLEDNSARHIPSSSEHLIIGENIWKLPN